MIRFLRWLRILPPEPTTFHRCLAVHMHFAESHKRSLLS
jgi:hypothetical protein